MASNACSNSRCPKEAPRINGCRWSWSKAVTVLSLGRCTASCTVCPPDIQGLGFRMWRSLLVAMLYAPRCESVGTFCGRKIAHRGPNDRAWSAKFVAPSEAVGGVLSHSQAMTCLIDISFPAYVSHSFLFLSIWEITPISHDIGIWFVIPDLLPGCWNPELAL